MVGADVEGEHSPSTTPVSVRSMMKSVYQVLAATVPVSRQPLPVPTPHDPVVLVIADGSTMSIGEDESSDALPAAVSMTVFGDVPSLERVSPNRYPGRETETVPLVVMVPPL